MKRFIFCLLVVSTTTGAEIYRWTDAHGNVHYGDRPEKPQQATELSIDSESRAGISSSATRKRERELVLEEFEEEREARKQNLEKKRLAKRTKQQQCALAQDDLRRYEHARAIYRLDNKGERKYYSKEQREAREKKLRQLINKHCN